MPCTSLLLSPTDEKLFALVFFVFLHAHLTLPAPDIFTPFDFLALHSYELSFKEARAACSCTQTLPAKQQRQETALFSSARTKKLAVLVSI